jgi:hypothetical protein
MNIFQKIAFVNRISKAVKKSKLLIDSKKDLAEKVRKHIDNIIGEVQELVRLLPDFRNVYLEVVEIVENIK